MVVFEVVNVQSHSAIVTNSVSLLFFWDEQTMAMAFCKISFVSFFDIFDFFFVLFWYYFIFILFLHFIFILFWYYIIFILFLYYFILILFLYYFYIILYLYYFDIISYLYYSYIVLFLLSVFIYVISTYYFYIVLLYSAIHSVNFCSKTENTLSLWTAFEQSENNTTVRARTYAHTRKRVAHASNTTLPTLIKLPGV